MRKTSESNNIDLSGRITVNTNELKAGLGCGYQTAVQIGMAAGAKVCIGRRVLWNTAKIQKYLDSVSNGE